MKPERIRVAVSACLLGDQVRYNGGHKRDAYITDVLSHHFEYVPLCPEVAIGLGVPRATLQLRAIGGAIHAIQPKAGDRDVTKPLADHGRDMADSQGGISGYIFKSRSPSCGIGRVKVYDRNGSPSSTAAGIYAAAFRERQPLLPVEDEGRLNDAGLRDNFIARVYVYYRWQKLEAAGIRAASLVRFHAEHKFLVLAHSQAAARELGRMLSNLKTDTGAIASAYIVRLMRALSRPATRGNQANALQHAAGYFRKLLDVSDRRELADAITAFLQDDSPIIVPLTLIRHHLRRHPQVYLNEQTFLQQPSHSNR